MAANIRDVARSAGVSVGTVSRVLNGHPSVRPALRARVEEAIRNSGFRPSARARNFARKSSGCVGFLLANRPVLQPFIAWVLNGVMHYCEERGYFVECARMQCSPASPLLPGDLPRMLRTDGAVDVLIVVGTIYPNLVECLDQIETSYVLAGNGYVSDSTDRRDQVRFDHASGGRQAAEYLIQLGHRDIWYVGDLSFPWYVDRYEGYRGAMRDAGLEPRSQVEGVSDDRFLNGLHSTAMILAQKQPVTAIIGSTNEVAYGAWEAVEAQNLRVPADVSLVGFDDERTSHNSRPLTTIWVDAEEEGRQLAKMAIAKIHSPGVRSPEVVIPTHLVKFNTCGAILAHAAHEQ